MALSSVSSRKGLYKKATAPASSARPRASSSPCDVMKTIGIRELPATSWRWSSSPLMPGIRTSRIRHAVLRSSLEFKNASAEEKPWARNPTDRIRLLSEFLRESSSSTIDMRGAADIGWYFLFLGPLRKTLVLRDNVAP